MRRVVWVSIITVSISTLLFRCNSTETSPSPAQQTTLKQSLNSGADQVKTAIEQIKNSPGYQVLSINDGSSASGGRVTGTNDTLLSIDLNKIKGVYAFTQDTTEHHWKMPFYDQFLKTADNDQFVIEMPEALAKHPWHYLDKNSDSTYANNFVVTTSEFKYLLTGAWDYNYRLNSSITLDDNPAGSISINSTSTSNTDYSYQSTYDFDNDYKLEATVQSGDTASVQYTLMQNEETLFMEAYQLMAKENSNHPDVEYTLAIGNVMIKRNSATDSIQVYKDNVLQANASISVAYTDDNDSIDDHSVFHHKEIQITFDDGTSTTISELMGSTLGDLGTLFADLRNAYFTKNIVNYVAFHAAYGG